LLMRIDRTERMNKPVTLTLPWPPSVNSHVRVGRGGAYTSKKWRAYLQAGIMQAAQCQRLGIARVSVDIDLYPPTRRAFDIDNRIKILLDVIERGGIIDNDNQVDKLRVKRQEKDPPGRAEITVRIIE